ncbi:hypothetical protein TNCV_807311 [Trichonephila clavipes]|nr:hypothetical protein TNCV_807311 [Trichonephila clavipes]
MLRDGTICPINSPYESPVVLTRRKMTFLQILPRRIVSRSINKNIRYPLPVIDDLLTNIPHTKMSTLDLGYFQLAISPKGHRKNSVYHSQWHFLHSYACLLVWGGEFPRAIDIILQPVIGRFVSVYMDDVNNISIVQKTRSFNSWFFTLLRDAGLR